MSSMDGHPHAPTIKEGIQNSIKIRERRSSGGDARQFVITQDGDGDLAVSEGSLYKTELNPVANTALWGMSSVTVFPLAAFTPTASRDYHFFLEVNRVSQVDEGQAAGSVGDLYLEEFNSANVVHHDVATGAGWTVEQQTEAQGAATYNYIKLGMAEVDGSGDATIEQDNFGPFTPPTPSYIYNFVSSEANNGLTEGGPGDGDLFVAVIDDDANQQLRFDKSGGDKGAYLRIIAGDAINVDATTAGEPVIGVEPADAVADDNTVISNPPTQGEVQALQTKINAILSSLRAADLMDP